MLGETAINAALELNSIKVMLKKKNLDYVIGLIDTAIHHKILVKDQLRAKQKELFKIELEKTIDNDNWLPVLNISLSYEIFGHIQEAKITRDMARDKGFPG